MAVMPPLAFPRSLAALAARPIHDHAPSSPDLGRGPVPRAPPQYASLLKCIAPVLVTKMIVASMDSVMRVKEHARKIWVPVIFVHHGASLTGSGWRPGERLLGSTAGPESPKGERAEELGAALLPKGEAALLEAPNGERGAASPPARKAASWSCEAAGTRPARTCAHVSS